MKDETAALGVAIRASYKASCESKIELPLSRSRDTIGVSVVLQQNVWRACIGAEQKNMHIPRVPLTTPYRYITVCSTANEPRMSARPSNLENTKTVDNLVTPENLQRHNKGVGHQVVVNSCMKNLYCPIIRRWSKKRICWMEMEWPKSARMVPCKKKFTSWRLYQRRHIP